MRILGVRFKNLNSLIGEWNIDFTHPDYSFNGIFAITGPTGAGKTTIMDAVCLGLYGRTPRLDKVTKSSNEIMSRQTGECFAEVTFETQKGRYRCHWGQHRARKRPDGELQQAKHEIADAESGTVLESRITSVNEFIENATGMDFERFTRSMLLAQGGFAAFLQASPDKRAPILEQITGTEIYSRISVKVHERSREERGKLDLLQAELKGIRVLNADEERDLRTGLKETQSHEAALGGQLDGLRKAATWLETMAVLEKGIGELDKLTEDCEKRSQVFESERIRLEKSRRALGLEGDYRGVVALRDLQKNEYKELQDALAALPLKEKACHDAVTIRKTAEAGRDDARKRQQSEAEVIKKIRDLDARLSEQKKQIEKKDTSISSAEKQGKAYTANIDKAAQALQESRNRLKAVEDYQAKHACDAALLTDLGAISKGFASLRDHEERNGTVREACVAAAKAKETAVAAHKKIAVDHEKSRKEFEKRQGDVKVLTDKIASILKGRAIGWWHQEQSALKEREGLLKQTGDTIGRMNTASTALGKLNTRLSVENIISSISSEYFNFVQQQIHLRNLKNAVDLSRERVRIVEARYQVGAGSRLDLQQAKVDFNTDSSLLIQQKETLYASRIRLNELMGVDVNREFVAGDTDIHIGAMLPKEALQDQIKQQNALLMLSEKNKNISELDLKILQSRN